ncbi:hypothetical protein A3K86_12950 [Photobacterium jeanii]|uniref:Uncharacterized protein n=1 Tax=Photobacterium jeanii TaxID=858640 RepID=A0A178K9C0_9GAMM|nr:DUF2057 domain-containing protein [Photobacterium jeanii]OAN13931.1 hypothetical protein A3K86_12950 [Photobacterium jeanii]PST89916.1 DUF2057 domain-containing protein [Photobacterium jeanii]
MKVKPLALAALLLPLAPSAMAEVTLEIPRGVQLLVVNEQDAGASMFGFDHQPQIQLPDGTNQIAFRIAKIVRESGSLKTKYKSTAVVARFDAMDATLKLDIPNIETLDQGRDYNRAPTFTITKNGKAIEVAHDNLNTGLDISPDFVSLVERYNKTNGIAATAYVAAPVAVAQTTAQPKVQKTVPTKKVAVSDSNADPAIMLRHWFEQADENTKKEFLSWAVTNIN